MTLCFWQVCIILCSCVGSNFTTHKTLSQNFGFDPSVDGVKKKKKIQLINESGKHRLHATLVQSITVYFAPKTSNNDLLK